MNEDVRGKLRLLLLDDAEDPSRDELIELLYELASAGLRSRLASGLRRRGKPPDFTIPEELQWIPIEVTVKRFNRIGSEGFSSESVDGHSISLDAGEFDEYESLIDAWCAAGEETGRERPGRIRVY